VGLSYGEQGTTGLGWPDGSLVGGTPAGALGAGTTPAGGLGWPGGLNGMNRPRSGNRSRDGNPGVPGDPGRTRGSDRPGDPGLPQNLDWHSASRGVPVDDGSEAIRDGVPGSTGVNGTLGVLEDSGVSEQRPDPASTVAHGTRPVIVPEIPPNPVDTPIAFAAEAAVNVRGKGDRQPWPRPPRCRIMTIANQKGGVGKTTTAVNLAASLAQHGSRVLVVDLDPQGNASTALDVEHHAGVPSVYDVLVDERPLAEVVRPAGEMPGLYCAPATIDLAGAEIELVPVVARELRLAKALRGYDTSHLDYVLVDCPPSLGLLTLNALVAAEEVLLPIQCEYYALEGVQQLLNTAELVRVNFNPGLHVSTVLLTMYDGRTRLASDVADDVRAHFGTSVLRTIIPRSVRVSEAPSRGQSVIAYDPGSSGAIAYTEAAKELAMQSAGTRQQG
jgi:chromosome partitioning protein